MSILSRFFLGILCIVLLMPNAVAQNRSSIWIFGDSAGIDFSNVLNPVPIISNCQSRGTVASIADSAGDFLFYTSPKLRAGTAKQGKVYNRQFHLMDNGDSLQYVHGIYNSAIIIPNPAGNNQYYIFNVNSNVGLGSVNGLFYSVVDLNYNNGLGKVTTKNQHLITTDYMTDAMAAVKHGNGRDWWVLCKPLYIDTLTGGLISSDTFYIYLVTPDSIHTPVKQCIGYNKASWLGNFTFSSDGSKFNFVCYSGLSEIMDFDRCTGTMSNANIITDSLWNMDNSFIGSAFSPNDSLLYIIKGVYYPFYLLQYDIYSQDMDTIAQITGTQTVVNRGRSPGHIRLAPDGKIYMTASYTDTLGYLYFPYADSCYFPENMYLGVINNPNVKGVGCNFNNFGFYLGGKRTYWGLPNNPDDELGALAGSGCDTITNLTPELCCRDLHLKIFPNPANETITIKFNHKNVADYTVFDTHGRIVQQGKINDNSSISVKQLPQGMYFVFVSNNEISCNSKFIKK